MNTEYKTEFYNATKGFVYLLIYFLIFIIILIFVSRWLQSPLFAVGGWICLCILPFIFEKKIKKSFTKRILLEFNDLNFSVQTYKSNEDIVSKKLQIKWSEIRCYKFYFTPANNTILYLYLRDGSKKRWNFKDNKTFEEAIKGDSIFNIFFSYIKQYNITKINDEKITLKESFLNSKKGTIILYLQIVIIVGGIIFHIIMHPPSSIITILIGISFVMQLFMQRKDERVIIEKISSLE